MFLEDLKTHEGAVVTDEFCGAANLSSCALTYTAELSAITEAMNVACQTGKKPFVIYSDSKSALESLNNYSSSHPLVQKQRWPFANHLSA